MRNNGWLKNYSIICLLFVLTACSVTPKPISVEDRYQEAQSDLRVLYLNQGPTVQKIDFYQALARGIQYNLEYRLKLVNTALQAGQLDIAEFTMFPALNPSYSIYNRSNQYASSGITSTGAPTDVLNSTPNTIRSSRIGASWSVLDFGLGYVKARQQGNRIYIAEEEARKQMQQLSQDILLAYWNAYSAQQLMHSAKEFQVILYKANKKLVRAMHDPTIPKENILNYQAALLEGNRRIVQLQYKYDKAILDLKHLLNLSPNTLLILAPPPLAFAHVRDLSHLDFAKVDAITLVSRPELRGQNYQERIAKLGMRAALLQAMPGLSINFGQNYNSNQFLLNKTWLDTSFDVAWNLLNLASLPTSYEAAKMQEKYEKLKLMALTLTVLVETRYAYVHYESLHKEYEIVHLQTKNAEALYLLNKHRQLASLASDQQVITAKLKALTSKMDENSILSDLSTALGELYLSTGSDLIPQEAAQKPLPIAAEIIKRHFAAVDTWDFSQYVDNTYAQIFGQRQPFTTVLLRDYHNAKPPLTRSKVALNSAYENHYHRAYLHAKLAKRSHRGQVFSEKHHKIQTIVSMR